MVRMVHVILAVVGAGLKLGAGLKPAPTACGIRGPYTWRVVGGTDILATGTL
jgi:hypothetical protein